MKCVRIPNTDLDVSVICLGTMTYGTPVGEADAIRLTHWAIDHGINFIDTANIYEGYSRFLGSPGGVAEAILGKALKGRRDRVVLATKVGNPVGPGPEDKGLGTGHIRRELDKSLARMQTDHVDLYYLHRPDPETPIAESLGEYNRLIDSGKVNHYGFSNYDAAGIAAILETCDREGLRRPVVCQPAYSLLKREAERDVIPLCVRERIAVVPYQVLQGGLLTGKYRRGTPLPAGSRMVEKAGWLPALDDGMFDAIEAIAALAAGARQSVTEYVLRETLNRPGITSVLVGVKRIDQLEEALKSAEG
jgi:aryl-alcohol dehydrogenase-like predicted oxidoreductase